MPLSNTKVRALKPREKKYIESDEKGLTIEVTPTGAKRWVFRFRHHGKRPEMALGLYPDVSVKRTRKRLDKARQQVAEGIDPRDIKRTRKESALKANRNSFAAVSDEWFATKMANLSSSSKDRATLALERDLKPYLGKRPIS